MAINVEVNQDKKQQITYPCLMRTKLLNIVVLFIADGKGVLISKGESQADSAKVGNTMGYWTFPAHPEEWEPSPPVTISNA